MVANAVRSLAACAVALSIALASAAEAAPLAPGLHAFSIPFQGLTRRYDVYVPARYDGTAAPLVLDFHGFASSKDSQRIYSHFDRGAELHGYLVAYPQGYGFLPSWNTPICCGEAQELGLDDVGLAVAIVDAIAAATPVDRARVYATGLSNGGALAHLLACSAADTFAAVAPVSFPLPVAPPDGCRPVRGIPVVHFHGTKDTTVPFSTPSALAPYSAPESLAAWAGIDQCTAAPTRFFQTQTGSSFCSAASACRGGVMTILCGINGTHLLYDNADAIPIAELAWAVLSQYRLPRPPRP